MSDSNARSNPVPKVWQYNFCLAICYSRNTTSKTCELKSTFGFYQRCHLLQQYPWQLGRDSRMRNDVISVCWVAGQLVFNLQNSAPLHVTSLPSSLSSISSLCMWKSDTGREKAPGEIKTANQICKVFHISLMSRHHQLSQ